MTLFEPQGAANPDPYGSPADSGSGGFGPTVVDTPPRPRRKRSVTVGWVLLAAALVGVLVLGLTPSPYVIEEPGPVFNTLGTDQAIGRPADPSAKPKSLISIPDETTYPTSGSLDMLTVSVVGNPDELPSWIQVVEAWFDPSKAVVPVNVEFPQNQTVQQQDQENAQEMVNSQQDAVAAALNQLGDSFPQRIVVKQIVPKYPADGVLKENDQITSVNGQAVKGVQSLRTDLQKSGAGTPAQVGIVRAGVAQTVQVTPADSGGAAVLGIGTAMDYTFPINVKIQLNNVGGPSAGQMFALGIIDKLTPGYLNGGARVAGTGTIDNEGNVGAIGGIQQKMFGARAAGAKYFLAPASNCDEVTGHIPSGLQVFAVNKLSDSMKVLKAISSHSGLGSLPRCPAS